MQELHAQPQCAYELPQLSDLVHTGFYKNSKIEKIIHNADMSEYNTLLIIDNLRLCQIYWNLTTWCKIKRQTTVADKINEICQRVYHHATTFTG